MLYNITYILISITFNEEVIKIPYSIRQKKIIDIVKENQPITSEEIAKRLDVTRATLRPDLAVLTMTCALEAKPKVGYCYVENSIKKFINKEINHIKVGDIKSTPIVVDEKKSIYDVIVTMFLEDVGTIYVVSEGYLSGVVSRKDLLKAAIGGTDLTKIPIGVIMFRMPNIIMSHCDESILEAAAKIIEHEVDSLPVVETEVIDNKDYHKVIGRISKTNITKYFVEISTAS